MFPSINFFFLSKISIVLNPSKLSFFMVIFCFFHADLDNLDVVAMVFVFNNFFLKTTFRSSCQLKSVHFSFQY